MKEGTQVSKTQVLSGGNLRWKKSTRGTQVLETRVPQNKTKRKKNTKHREKSINFELVPSFLKRFFFCSTAREREREREATLLIAGRRTKNDLAKRGGSLDQPSLLCWSRQTIRYFLSHETNDTLFFSASKPLFFSLAYSLDQVQITPPRPKLTTKVLSQSHFLSLLKFSPSLYRFRLGWGGAFGGWRSKGVCESGGAFVGWGAKGVCKSRVLVFFFFFELKFHVYYFYTSDCHHLELEFPFLNSNLWDSRCQFAKIFRKHAN